jgi:FMN phosphatase YigB (HAD superfamily)
MLKGDLTFKQFLTEETSVQAGTLHVFDIDDTLLRPSALIHVKQNGQTVKRLSNQEFNDHNLPPGHEYDFTEFRDAEKFRNESQPIMPMIEKVKAILANIKANPSSKSRIIMNTARGDFDNKDVVLDTFRQYGIDMNHIHLHRAGNIPGSALPAEKKLVYIRRYLHQHPYEEVHMYDDSKTNLTYFLKLTTEFPNTKFVAWLVNQHGRVQKFGS